LTPPLLKVLSGETLDVPPIWMMRQAGRHLPEYLKVRATCENFIDFCFSPDKAAEVTLQPIRRYDMDYETVSKVREGLADDKALIGFCGGPWTVATYMIEGEGTPKKEMAKRFAYENPEAMDDLLEALAISSADYLIGQAKAGADVLKIFESWAEGLSPDLFERLVIAPTKMIIDRVRAAGIDKPIMGFPRGAGLNALRYAQATGITAIAAGTDTPMDKFRKRLPDNMPYQGNLDPLALRIGGDVLRRAVQTVLDTATGPHIFNLGHGVTPDVKIANVEAVVNHIRTGDGDYV